jgi:hypothetical protein
VALLSAKSPDEVVWLVFDFSELLDDIGILSATCSVAIAAGDPNGDVGGMLQQLEVVGGVVRQQLAGGAKGSVYRVLCTATCDDSPASVFQLAADVPVRTIFGV